MFLSMKEARSLSAWWGGVTLYLVSSYFFGVFLDFLLIVRLDLKME